MDETEIAPFDCFSEHAEEIIRARYDPRFRTRAHIWPDTGRTLENEREKETLLARVNGVVAGRAILEALSYPLAEIVNLEVAPQFRGRGIASRIVAEAARQAAGMGFLAIHLQTDLDNIAAHHLYARHGFLPATKGQMIRLVRFLNYPMLSQFLSDHPLAMFRSRTSGLSEKPSCELSWTNFTGDDNLAIGLSGGSCQADSDGFGPGVSSCELRIGGNHLNVSLAGPREVNRREVFTAKIAVENRGNVPIDGACRLLLNQGFTPADSHRGGCKFQVGPGASEMVELPVKLAEGFTDELLVKTGSYPSVSVAAEVFVRESVLWLSWPLKLGNA